MNRKCVAGLFVLLGGELMAGETNLVIREQLNRRWAGQLVSYPFQAEAGQCLAGSVALTGPQGPQPVQLFDVQTWPGSDAVQSARVAFVVNELNPLTTNSYQLSYGKKLVAPVASALQVKADARQVELVTPKIAVRLPVGSQTFDPPASADQVPGPIAAVRIGDEPWFGQSNLYGPGLIMQWSAKLIDNGPVFARVESTYTYANGTVLTLRVQASTGENTIRCDMEVTGEQPNDGWSLALTPATAFSEMQNVYGLGTFMRETKVPVPAAAGDKPLAYLSPWAGDYWFPDSPAIIRLRRAAPAPELQLCVRDIGDWVVPQDRPSWSNFATWSNAWDTPPRMWAGWQSRRIPLLATGGGGVRLQVNLMSGRRHWTMTSDTDGTAVMDTFLRKAMTTHGNLPLLDEVKDMVLDWPDGAPEPQGAATPVVGDEVLDKLAHIDIFRMNEGMRIFDRYRRVLDAATSPAQRRLHKAQMAYLAYMAADPRHWSFERGFSSGNPNMTVTRVCNIGLFGLTLTGHPKSREWFEYANNWMKYWLAETVTEKGYWPESAHYAGVSLAAMGDFAAASANTAGYRVSADPKYQALQQFYGGKVATPAGVIVPYGRGGSSHLGGPRQAGWTSEHFPHFGFILRSHAATSGENFLLYLPYRAQSADGEIWPHEVGSIGSWYAAGQPVAGWHPQKKTPPNRAVKPHIQIDDIATSGTLAKTRANGFALLPRADYVSASFSYAGDPKGLPWACHCGACPKEPKPFPGKTDDYAWTTQLLLIHDDKPDGVNYLILRDTVDIDKPSTWAFPVVEGALTSFVVSPGGQLELPGAGAYYVALIPKTSGTVEATAPGDGKVIRLTGAFGTDYCFLGRLAGDKATCGDAAFEGTAGAVQDRPGALMLQLSAPGMVRYKEYALSGSIPAALRATATELTVALSEPWPGGEVVVQAPGKWTTTQATASESADKQLLLRVPAGVHAVQLRRSGP